MKKVAVLMSTYNGEKFLKEQIDSILFQTGVEIYLRVRDDGSTDRTLEILRGYAQQGMLCLEEGTNCGVGNSFMKLLYNTPDQYDFYAFSDQDDIWLPEKLNRAILKLETYYDFPCLYASNQVVIDQFGNQISMRYKQAPIYTYQQIINKNYLSGCTMVWNQKLFGVLTRKENRPTEELLKNRIHDVWIAMVASVVGTIIFDLEGLILYRQHRNNVVGVRKDTWFDRMKTWWGKMNTPYLRNGRSKLCREIYERFQSNLNEKEEKIYMYSYYEHNWKLKKELLKNSEIRKYSQELSGGFYIKVLCNIF